MRIGIVVDSSCDLPPEFVQQHNICVLPATIRVDSELFTDERNEQATLAFYESHIGDKTHDAETFPITVEQTMNLFLGQLVLDFDFIFCIPVWKARSKLYENVTRASFAILSSYRKHRAAAGANGPFAMRVIDSKQLFSGVAVQAAEAATLAREGRPHADIRSHLNELTDNTVGYLVPADLAYIRKRAVKRGEKSIGLATYLIGNALDIKPVLSLYREQTQPVAKLRGVDAAVEKMFTHVAGVVRDGRIFSRHVCVSFGGNPLEVPVMRGFSTLKHACDQRGLALMTTFMGASATVNVGAGAVSVSYAGEYREMH